MTRERRRGIILRQRTVTGIILVAAISFLAGMTDAAGLLIAGSFVSFMSGNTTRAAVALVDGQAVGAAILVGGLAMFVAGNALGVVIAHNAARRAFRILIGAALLLALAAIITEPGLATLQFYAIVLAMGLVNAAVEHMAGLPVGLTYVTGALSRFGKGIGNWIIGTARPDWGLQIVPWLGMISGGICGAFLERALGADALWIISAFAAVFAILAFFIPPRLQKRLALRTPPQATNFRPARPGL
ncbi:YoaK family protein [Rhizobium sp. LjRoot98]|uniref:YoaK family protein n=1 Tax=unclassified Rhizobium TaxID=2613769 RepID=UPI000714EF1D|nr:MULTISPECIES: YoaK family protein [unclassified Rhizobium]KQV40576.1 hypothetical protein ASC96_18955 [Rhizobium sp. Root1204]KQX98625.1 hypothetical protein ASD36_21110 [Rhizobium sp. Root1334]KRC10537.1 hypothetical protein ASE23_23485 [Rhizobium sp. Root73]